MRTSHRWTYRVRRDGLNGMIIAKDDYEVLRDGLPVGRTHTIGGRRWVARAYLNKNSWEAKDTFQDALEYIRETMDNLPRNPEVE